jgi:succinyl-diaminopimelate desuccinylase
VAALDALADTGGAKAMGSRDKQLAGLRSRLLARTLELVDIASESRCEGEITEHVRKVLEHGDIPVRDAGDMCLLAGATCRDGRPFVLLAGHLDTVPAQGNRPGRTDGECIVGLGASDMKGGLAVMLELALAKVAGPFDVGFLFFGREELYAAKGALRLLLAREPGLRTADLAIVLEPTANGVQAGCLGNLDAAWTFTGRAGHSARPWLADNAIDRAVAGIARLHAVEPDSHLIDGLEFVQVVSVTSLHAGVAPNVIPGEATAHVNFRYAPDTTPAEAEAMLCEWCEPYGEVNLTGNSPGALPPRENPILEDLLAIAGPSLEAKQAWTPVAEFAAVGVEAINFGPGDPKFAHRQDERIAGEALVRSYSIFESLFRA